MRIILTAPDTGRRWKLEPFDNGLCYQLWVTPKPGAKNKKGEPVKSEWTFTGKYPSDLEYGIEMMIDMMLADPIGNANIECDPKTLNRTFKKMFKEYIDEMIESVQVEMTELEMNAVDTLVDTLVKTKE